MGFSPWLVDNQIAGAKSDDFAVCSLPAAYCFPGRGARAERNLKEKASGTMTVWRRQLLTSGGTGAVWRIHTAASARIEDRGNQRTVETALIYLTQLSTELVAVTRIGV